MRGLALAKGQGWNLRMVRMIFQEDSLPSLCLRSHFLPSTPAMSEWLSAVFYLFLNIITLFKPHGDKIV